MRLSRFFAALALIFSAACSATHAQPRSEAIPALYPEGPLWVGERLYYAEMGADRVSVVENGQRRDFFRQRECGPTAIAPYGDGFLILCHIGARVVAVNAQGAAVRAWTRDAQGHLLRDPNDCYADGRGGVYFSDPGNFTRFSVPHGYVMHLTADGQLTRVAGPLWYPNGVFIDQARSLAYVTEHMTGRILLFDLEADGSLANQRTYIDLANVPRRARYRTPYEETGPDGLEIGPDGDLWVSVYGEGRILRFSPQKRLVGMIELPTRYSTNIAFNAQGVAATTGITDNINPPFPGEVRFHPPSSLTRTAE